MGILELFVLAVGLSMDAFAVSICIGLSFKRISIKNCLIVGLYFGIFQALMPLIGYFVGSQFAKYITAVDHWIAFVLLTFIGARMILGSRKKDEPDEAIQEASLAPRKMLPLAVATSIDALAVGVSLAFLDVQILPAVSFIGGITLLLSMLGVKLGHVFGMRFRSIAELAGGVILVLIGLKILLEHLGVIAF